MINIRAFPCPRPLIPTFACFAIALLIFTQPSMAQEPMAGPELLAAETPYILLDGRLAHFAVDIVDRTPGQLQADWGTQATRALALSACDLRPRSFEDSPNTPSHAVGDAWRSIELPTGSTLMLAWDAQGYDGPAMWFAAQWDGVRLAVFSSRVDPNAPDRWYPLEPGKSSYDVWTDDGLQVEMEVFLPESIGKTVLYRFRPLTRDGGAASPRPAPPAGAPLGTPEPPSTEPAGNDS